MPEPSNTDVAAIRAVNRTLLLSIDLVNYELTHPADRLKLVLEDPKVYWQIQEQIQKQAQFLIEPTLTQYYASGEKASRIAMSSLQIAGPAVWESILKSPRYKAVEGSLQALKMAAARTPAGILVDRHKGELLFVGSALVLAGGFAQYRFRGNDNFAALYAAAVSAGTKKINLGNLTFGATVPTFVPSKQQLEFKGNAGYDFKVVDTKIEFGGKVDKNQFNRIDASAVLSVPLTVDKLDLKLKAGAGGTFTLPNGTQPFGTTWKYSLGIDATSKDTRFKAGILVSGENQNLTFNAGLHYHF